MVKVEQEKQPAISYEFIRLLLAEYGIESFQFTPATSGIENTTLIINERLGKRVLRIYRQGKKEDKKIQEEIDFTLFLKEKGIPVPALYTNIQGDFLTTIEIKGQRWQVLLMEFIAGSHPQDYSHELCANLATIQAQIHLLGAEYAHQHQVMPVFEMQSHMTPTELKLLEAFVRDNSTNTHSHFIQRALSNKLKFSPSLPFGVNHLDLDAGNILVGKDKVLAILDFDDLDTTPSVECLGNTLWHIFHKTHSKEKVIKYLSTYESLRKLEHAELEVLHAVMSFRNYVLSMMEVALWGARSSEMEHYLELEKLIVTFRFD